MSRNPQRSGCYSCKSAYNTYFFGSIKFVPWKRVRKKLDTAAMQVFLTVAVNNRCLIANRLAKWGLPDPCACEPVPYVTKPMKWFSILLVSFLFAQKVWKLIFQKLGLVNLSSPKFSNPFFELVVPNPKDQRDGLNSLIILVARELWKHQCFLNGVNPNVLVGPSSSGKWKYPLVLCGSPCAPRASPRLFTPDA